MREFCYHAPSSLNELFELSTAYPKDNIRYLAGGTDYVPKLNKMLDRIPTGDEPTTHLIYMGKLGFNDITEEDHEVRIGALTTLADILEDRSIHELYPVLYQGITELAGFTVRSIATIGGNLCNASPAADTATPLLVLDAQMVILGREGERVIPIIDFFKGPGVTILNKDEILKEIIIRKQPGKSAFMKLGRRKAETLSIVNAAAYVEIEEGVFKEVRCAAGAVAPTPVRCYQLENELVGKEVSIEVVEAAAKNRMADDIHPIDDLRASAWYRHRVAPVIMKRAILKACGLWKEEQ